MKRQGEDLAVASEQSTCVTDRKLLELAALAAGIELKDMADWPHLEACRYWSEGCDCGAAWNPLANDGDAFTLAVKLSIAVYPPEKRANSATANGPGHNAPSITERSDGDPRAATRRAIVRAAAEIGLTLSNAGAQPSAPIK